MNTTTRATIVLMNEMSMIIEVTEGGAGTYFEFYAATTDNGHYNRIVTFATSIEDAIERGAKEIATQCRMENFEWQETAVA